MHDTGPPWIATPSMLDSFIPFYMPVYPGALPVHTLSQVAYFSENGWHISTGILNGLSDSQI